VISSDLYCRFVFYGFIVFVYLLLLFYFFFFSSRRRHTRSKRDWSSDVCSSDLSRSPSRKRRRASQSRPCNCISTTVRKRTTRTRSEERRVGKECRYRWSPDH